MVHLRRGAPTRCKAGFNSTRRAFEDRTNRQPALIQKKASILHAFIQSKRQQGNHSCRREPRVRLAKFSTGDLSPSSFLPPRASHVKLAAPAPPVTRLTAAMASMPAPEPEPKIVGSKDAPVDLTGDDEPYFVPEIAARRSMAPMSWWHRVGFGKRATAEDPGELIVPPVGRHTHTVVLLHGMYSPPEECEMFKSLPAYVAYLGASGVKFVFPHAPRRTITWPTGPEANVASWYNYFTRRDGWLTHDELDEAHLASQTRRLHSILQREAALLGGDTRRLLLGGSSQGGTVALHAAISFGRPLGALLCLRSCLVDSVTFPKDKRNATCKTPVFVFLAGDDCVYAVPLQERGYSLLESAGFYVEKHIEPGLSHWDVSRNELRCTAAWIGRVARSRRLRSCGQNDVCGQSDRSE
mmetsp:Transcript_65445/g.108793  ORF Transcript_65445/g.108793 Transcript_65445/m.108793 type:complete len:411 (-) Transcript_65445:197-1429(-)